MATIRPNKIQLDDDFIKSQGGIIKALNFTSAKYLRSVLDKSKTKPFKSYPKEKVDRLKNIVVHTNPHLDEYFAELLFRAILPDSHKTLPLVDYVRTNNSVDSYTDSLWPNSAVFGILPDDRSESKALDFFDEHRGDGTRSKYSCSQIIADEFFLGNTPKSFLKILKHVNYTDSQSGSHQFNLKNIIFKMHEIHFIIKWDPSQNRFISKKLDEEWKRSIVGACLTAMVYILENRLIEDELPESRKIQMEAMAKRSFDYFLSRTVLKDYSPEYFKQASSHFLYLFKVGNHKTIDGAIWKNADGDVIDRQILIIHYLVFATEKCWGKKISSFIMMHIWQILMQYQLSFLETRSIIQELDEMQGAVQTNFGSIQKYCLNDLTFQPEQQEDDSRKREFKENSELWVYEIFVDNPNYPNVFNVANSVINNAYSQKGNNGFGYVVLRDLTNNSMIISSGSTVPYRIRKKVSDEVKALEEECWFQLVGNNGLYTPWILNRTKSHQEQPPSKLMSAEKVIEFLKSA
jgi:hypothetical protein